MHATLTIGLPLLVLPTLDPVRVLCSTRLQPDAPSAPGPAHYTHKPRLILRRWFQPPAALGRPVGVELGQVEQGGIHPERIPPVTLEIGIHLVPVGAREQLDRGALGVGVGIPVRRRSVSKVESTQEGVSDRDEMDVGNGVRTRSRRCAKRCRRVESRGRVGCRRVVVETR
jgi:hypothetical protein